MKALKYQLFPTENFYILMSCEMYVNKENCTMLDSMLLNQKYVYWHILWINWHQDLFIIFFQKLFSNFRTQRTQDMTELPQTSLQTGCKVTSLSKNRHIFLIAWKVFWWDNRSIFGYTKIYDSIKGHNLNLQLITSLEVSVIYKVS